MVSPVAHVPGFHSAILANSSNSNNNSNNRQNVANLGTDVVEDCTATAAAIIIMSIIDDDNNDGIVPFN